MRSLVRSIVVLALLGAAPVPAPSSDEAAVAQAVEAFQHAMLNTDWSSFKALRANQLSYGHSGGRVESKAQCIEATMSGRSTWKVITLTDHPHRRRSRHRAAPLNGRDRTRREDQPGHDRRADGLAQAKRRLEAPGQASREARRATHELSAKTLTPMTAGRAG
jgi:hypothetical protein